MLTKAYPFVGVKAQQSMKLAKVAAHTRLTHKQTAQTPAEEESNRQRPGPSDSLSTIHAPCPKGFTVPLPNSSNRLAPHVQAQEPIADDLTH